MIPSPPFGLVDLVAILCLVLPMMLFLWFFGNGRVPITPSLLIVTLIVVGILGLEAET